MYDEEYDIKKIEVHGLPVIRDDHDPPRSNGVSK